MSTLIQSFHQTKRWLAENSLRWITLLIVVGLILFSVAFPAVVSLRQIQLLQLMVLGIGVVIIFSLWPALSLVLTIFGGMFIPFSGPAGINVTVLGIGLLLGLWMLDMFINKRRVELVSSKPIRPVLFMVLIAIVAFIVGQLPWFSLATPAPLTAQLGGLMVFVLAAGTFLLIAHQIKDIRWLERITWLLMVVGAVYLAGWLVPGVGTITGRLYQNGTANNAGFWVWLVAMAFSQAIFNRKLHIGWRLVLGGLTIATLYVAYFLNSDWKSGYIPVLVTVTAIIILSNLRLGLIVALLGYLPARYLFSDAIATEAFSFATRMEAWAIMVEISKKNPLLGFGPANYYWYVPLYRIRGYYSIFSSHNQYLDIIAQTGLLGLACLLWFSWEVGRLGWRLRTKVPEGFARAYVYGTLGGFVGILASGMLADWLIPFVYNIGLTGLRSSVLTWVFLGGLVSLEQMSRQ